jgi:hypothetical protein
VHDLRYTCAPLWLGAGADPKVVLRILGHASAAMTMDPYDNLIDHNLWAAAARFDGLNDRGGTTGAPTRLGAENDKTPGEELGPCPGVWWSR